MEVSGHHHVLVLGTAIVGLLFMGHTAHARVTQQTAAILMPLQRGAPYSQSNERREIKSER